MQSIAVATALSASFLGSIASALLSATSGVHLGLIQSAYHIQILAMTANFASPGISEGYRSVALTFRW